MNFRKLKCHHASEAIVEAMGAEVATRCDLELLKRDLKIWFGTVMVAAVGIILAAIRYLPPQP